MAEGLKTFKMAYLRGNLGEEKYYLPLLLKDLPNWLYRTMSEVPVPHPIISLLAFEI